VAGDNNKAVKRSANIADDLWMVVLREVSATSTQMTAFHSEAKRAAAATPTSIGAAGRTLPRAYLRIIPQPE
jgi:hypothetical protein